MNNDREYLRNLVDIIDGNASGKRNITESKQSLLESKRSQALNEARNLAKLIESSDLTEEQLNELLAGLGALGRAAGNAIGGAAKKVGQAVGAGAQKVGQAAQRAGGAAMSGIEKASGAAQAGVEKVGGALGNAALKAADTASNTIQKGVNAASAAAQKVGGAAQQAGQAVKSTYQAGEDRAAIKNALQTVTGIQSTLSSMPALKALASKGDNVTLGQLKSELQKLSAAE